MPSSVKQEIKTDKAPKIAGPLSQGIRAGNMIVVPCGPIDIKGNIIVDSFERGVRQMMENTKNILEAANASMDNIIRVDVYLQDMRNLDDFNRVYLEYFSEPFPVRSMSQPARTPFDLPCAMVVTAIAD